MARNDDQPVIFALSNPTSKSECTPDDVAAATNGRGLVATGSPFPGVSQCNNMFVFPGVGLGALVSEATRITPEMFLRASKALSGMVRAKQRAKNLLLPDVAEVRSVAFQIARAVAFEARDSGLGRLLSDDEYEAVIRNAQWEPRYYAFRPGN